jgi:hypothetical protein
MAARFAVVTEEEIAKIKDDSIPKKPKQATRTNRPHEQIVLGTLLSFLCQRSSLRGYWWGF